MVLEAFGGLLSGGNNPGRPGLAVIEKTLAGLVGLVQHYYTRYDTNDRTVASQE